MYEIWLMLNIVWETLLGAWPLVMALLLVFVAGMAIVLARGGADWRRAWPPALAGALIVGALVVVGLPRLTGSSLSELKYWVDWLALAGIAAACAAVAAALLLPWSALWSRRRT